MFTEILKIRPVLDPAATASMEQSLTGRFARVSKRFGAGLKNVIKGTVFGIGLGLLAQLLNPLENIEKKIKSLMDEGEDIRDFADRLGTDSGALKRTQLEAQTLGLKPEKFRELLELYAKAVETAREEIKSPQGITSESAKVVEKFIGEKDLLKGFSSFLAALRGEESGPGRRTELANGTVLTRTGKEVSEQAQRAVFGNVLHGSARRFMQVDQSLPDKTGLPSAKALGDAEDKAAKLADVQNAVQAVNEANNLIAAAKRASEEQVRRLEALKQREEAQTLKQFNNFETLAKSAELIQDLKGVLLNTQATLANILTSLNSLPTLLGQSGTITQNLSKLSDFIIKVQGSRWFRGITGGGQ